MARPTSGYEPLIAKTFHGLETVLAEELKHIGAREIRPTRRAVLCQGDRTVLYRANLWLRTALRVLVPIAVFRARHELKLYEKIRELNWRRYLSVDDTLAVDSVVASKYFPHSQFAARRVKDAIVDQFREATGRRPSVDTEDPTVRVHLHVAHDECTLALDSSGASLHKRGYRMEGERAPLNEVLAAGMVLLSEWTGTGTFIDPMCGSGTLAVEAGWIARRTAPGLMREDFGFMRWKDFDEALWMKIRQEAHERRRPLPTGTMLIASDASALAVEAAGRNITRAGLERDIHLSERDFLTLRAPSARGLIMMNPPYGERLVPANLYGLYRGMGDHLKREFAGYDAWVISADREALKRIGLRPSKKITLFNGSIECRFQHYALYKGSLKKKHQPTESL